MIAYITDAVRIHPNEVSRGPRGHVHLALTVGPHEHLRIDFQECVPVQTIADDLEALAKRIRSLADTPGQRDPSSVEAQAS